MKHHHLEDHLYPISNVVNFYEIKSPLGYVDDEFRDETKEALEEFNTLDIVFTKTLLQEKCKFVFVASALGLECVVKTRLRFPYDWAQVEKRGKKIIVKRYNEREFKLLRNELFITKAIYEITQRQPTILSAAFVRTYGFRIGVFPNGSGGGKPNVCDGDGDFGAEFVYIFTELLDRTFKEELQAEAVNESTTASLICEMLVILGMARKMFNFEHRDLTHINIMTRRAFLPRTYNFQDGRVFTFTHSVMPVMIDFEKSACDSVPKLELQALTDLQNFKYDLRANTGYNGSVAGLMYTIMDKFLKNTIDSVANWTLPLLIVEKFLKDWRFGDSLRIIQHVSCSGNGCVSPMIEWECGNDCKTFYCSTICADSHWGSTHHKTCLK
jgi:hypothetical protein